MKFGRRCEAPERIVRRYDGFLRLASPLFWEPAFWNTVNATVAVAGVVRLTLRGMAQMGA
jgi:hypothetical protein